MPTNGRRAAAPRQLRRAAGDPGLPVAALASLKPDDHNARRRTPRSRDMLAHSLRTFGAARSIVIDEDDIIRVGNGTAEAAALAGITNVRIVEADGKELIAVRRRGLSDADKRALSAADNRTAELAEWIPSEVVALTAAGVDLAPYWTPEEQNELASRAGVASVLQLAAGEGDDDGAADDADTPANDYQQFTCALTLDQERTVRAALRAARGIYQVDTTGNALTAALQAWMQQYAREAAADGQTAT